MHLFDAMLSSKNKVFTDFIQRKKDDWEIGKTIVPKDLITEAKSEYTNMITLKEWDRQDPKDVKIAAFTTTTDRAFKKSSFLRKIQANNHRRKSRMIRKMIPLKIGV